MKRQIGFWLTLAWSMLPAVATAQVPGKRGEIAASVSNDRVQPAAAAKPGAGAAGVGSTRAIVPVTASPSPRAERRLNAPPPLPGTSVPRSSARPAPASAAKPAVKVYDRQGKMLNGYKQVAPNRVLDIRTGRYHDTAPMGDGQRIVR